MLPLLLLLSWKDDQGNRPLNYLASNPSRDALAVIQLVLQVTLLKRIEFFGLAQWKQEIIDRMEEGGFLRRLDDEDSGAQTISSGDDLKAQLESRSRDLEVLEGVLAVYERLESIALLEHAVWKMALATILAMRASNQTDIAGVRVCCPA